MSALKITDRWLAEALSEALGGPPTIDALATITHLDWAEYRAEAELPWGSIRSIEPLRHCAALQVLSFDGNALSDLGPLASCAALREIWLVDNAVTDLAPLRGLLHLETLVLDCNRRLGSIAPLAGHPALRYLNIAHTAVTDLTPLAELPALTKVNVFGLKLDRAPDSPSMETLAALRARGVEVLGP
ncbi:MAG: hypothetical protein H6711_22065 [Myxococcales bacterium]|nr:hypothetical protein [Myxococcales bacterium]